MKASHRILSTTHRKIDPLRYTGHSEQYRHIKKGTQRTYLILIRFEYLSYINIIPLFGIIILKTLMVSTACKGEDSTWYTFSFT